MKEADEEGDQRVCFKSEKSCITHRLMPRELTILFFCLPSSFLSSAQPACSCHRRERKQQNRADGREGQIGMTGGKKQFVVVKE